MAVVNLNDLVRNCDWKYVGDTLVTDRPIEIYARVKNVDTNAPLFVSKTGTKYQIIVENYAPKKMTFKASDNISISSIDTVTDSEKKHYAVIFINYKSSQDDFFVMPVFPESIRSNISKCFELNKKDTSLIFKDTEESLFSKDYGQGGSGFFGKGKGKGANLNLKKWLLLAVAGVTGYKAITGDSDQLRPFWAAGSILSTITFLSIKNKNEEDGNVSNK